MRIIITENQHKLLEAIIDEAATPMSTKIELGSFIQILYLVNDVEKSQTLTVTEIHGSGQFITAVNNRGKFIINVGGSLDSDANTFTIRKDANYVPGSKTPGGKIVAPSVVGGTRIVVKNVTQVIISDSSKNVVDEVFTDLGDEHRLNADDSEEELKKQQQRSRERSDEKKAREKRVYDLVMSDPTLKKVFYHQPKILGKLLNYGKAKGLGPAQAVIDKYVKKIDKKNDSDTSKDFNNFKVNKSVVFELPSKPIRISYGGEDFSLLVGKKYTARYVGNQYLKGKHNGKIFKIYLKENTGNNIYKGTVKVFFKENDETIVDKMEYITIKVRDYNY